MLAHHEDRFSLLYLGAFPLLALVQWLNGFSPLLYFLMLLISVGLGVIHHNHTHLAMWRSRRLNRATDLYLSALQAVPSFVFLFSHIENHHRYRHGPRDETRTYRFGGDHNHLMGYLAHPILALKVLLPGFVAKLSVLFRNNPRLFRFALLQITASLAVWGTLAGIDLQKFLLYWLLPQMHGIHWLLGVNYLQHAHADGHSASNYARNFTGWVNKIWLNIGYHTAHHEYPRVHWSRLPKLHEGLKERIDPRLIERSLSFYLLRTFLLSLAWPAYRSRSLMQAG